ncbi:hypothetical protein NXY11_22540 [Parabacteroides faecis]|uniref:hypothetical protein n=1 Tax=Parabacteroides faecis TaxID=1217282 RepID=UPI0021643F6D|nr:hypothetical protein [Parabacteroides faecis]MCS2890410.1 hypothetical protein [Parabacteroides faecis]UVQ45904.1 hypothetical protein NXY11_22540 [Parabacteroides faecis]
MKTRIIIISFFFCLFMGISFWCGATTHLSGSQSADSVLWKQQLDAIMKNTVEYHLEYVLTDYKYIGKISTEKDLERVKLAILDGTGYPAEAYGKTKLVSLKEFSSIDKEKAENIRKDVKKSLDQLLLLRLGLEEVELEWTCNGTIYKTTCVVSNTLGVLYENVFMNSFMTGQTKTTLRSY